MIYLTGSRILEKKQKVFHGNYSTSGHDDDDEDDDDDDDVDDHVEMIQRHACL